MKGSMLPLIIGFLGLLLGKNDTAQSAESNEEIIFKDTLFGLFAFDSLKHDLGEIGPAMKGQKCDLIKHFKYLGDGSPSIIRTWTSDPHFLAEYPREPLEKNKLYTLRFCVSYRGGARYSFPFNKHIGFTLSDDKRVTFRLNGVYLPEKME